MAKRSSKLNLGYFCAVKNIVPIILVAIIVFFVFNLLQNKSFNPLFEGMEGKKLNEMVAKISDMSGNISELIKEIDEHTTEHEKNNHNHTADSAIPGNTNACLQKLGVPSSLADRIDDCCAQGAEGQ